MGIPHAKNLNPTAEPWTVSLRDGRWCIHRDEAECIGGSLRPSGQVIAWMPDGSQESYANAVLMSSAMEMQSALRAICASIATIPDNETEMMIAALSKASAMWRGNDIDNSTRR